MSRSHLIRLSVTACEQEMRRGAQRSSFSARADGVLACLLAFLAAVSAGCAPGGQGGAQDHHEAVLALEGGAAMVLTTQGFDAYAALFHPEYTNWSGGERVLDRAGFPEAVRTWHDAGNHAVCAALHPVSARRDGERWLLYRTSFSTVFRGPPDAAPSGLVPARCGPGAPSP